MSAVDDGIYGHMLVVPATTESTDTLQIGSLVNSADELTL